MTTDESHERLSRGPEGGDGTSSAVKRASCGGTNVSRPRRPLIVSDEEHVVYVKVIWG